MRGGVACTVSVAVCVSALISSNAPAAEWSSDVSAFLRQEYNDNITMTAAPHKAVLGNTASTLLALNRRDELLQVTASALGEYTAYIGESGLNFGSYDLKLTPVYQSGRAAWTLDGEMKQDVTLGSELRETGVVLTRDKRRFESASPSLSWSLTERSSIRVQYAYTHVRYPGTNPGLVDYEAQVADVDWLVSPTEKDTLTTTVRYLDYRTSSTGFTSQDYSLQEGLKHEFTETVRGELSAGADYTVSNSGAGASAPTDRQWGGLLNASLEQQSEVMLSKGSVSQEVLPSGGGYLVQTQHLSGLIRRELFQPVTAFVTADAYWTTALGTNNVPNGQYYTTSAGLSWRFKEHWTVDATYRYGYSDYQHATEAVTANAVYLRIAYNSHDLIFSP